MKGRCVWVVRSPRQHSITPYGVNLPHALGAKNKRHPDGCLYSWLFIAVIQYWTFSCVRRRTPTVIFTVPIPVKLYFIIKIRSKGFWFLFPSLGLRIDTTFAPVKMASNWSTANVERKVFAACSLVSCLLESLSITFFAMFCNSQMKKVRCTF